MRLLLKKGKEKELITKEKETLNLSLQKLANHLNIKLGKLLPYYQEKVLIPEEIFNRFSLKEKYVQFIIEKKENNWGQSKGGKNSFGSNIKEINKPKESKELAEFFGIMLGDGNLTKIKSYKKGTYQIRIVGDCRYDKAYLTNHVKPLIESLFSIQVKTFKSKEKNALNLVVTSKKLIEFLEEKGFKPGDKIRNQTTIPDWIKNNPQFLKVCLTGLYDTDGTIYKLTNQNSYQIEFTNYNLTLLNDVRWSLISLGINPSKIMRNRDIVITKKSELRKFLNEVGFHNFKHLNKAKMFNLAPSSSGQGLSPLAA